MKERLVRPRWFFSVPWCVVLTVFPQKRFASLSIWSVVICSAYKFTITKATIIASCYISGWKILENVWLITSRFKSFSFGSMLSLVSMKGTVEVHSLGDSTAAFAQICFVRVGVSVSRL